MLEQITPLILTFNEAPNLERTLARLTWAQRVVVVDSFSTDETLEIVKRFPQAEVVQRKFDSFAGQCNFGLQQVRTPWVLSLDADYVLTEELIAEMKTLDATGAADGFSARFKYSVYGHNLRASLYPPRTVLYRRDKARYEDDGHGHRVQISGPVKALESYIVHDDRKPLARWLWAQDKYATLEVQKLLAAETGTLPVQDRLRKMIWPAPFVVFFYTLFVKGMIFEGWPGWYYVLQRTVAELVLALRLIEAKFKRD
jgi:glycosyltransferase involved in cell wall biosynthesis